MTFRLRPETLAFVTNAPVVLPFSGMVRAPREQVFAALVDDPATWASWFPGLRNGAYDSPPPHGVGSARRVHVRGAGAYHETVMAWDAPVRWSYRVDRTSMPLARALIEEWTLEEAAGATRVTWTFAVDPMPHFGVVLRRLPGALGSTFRRALRNLEGSLTT